MLQNIDIVLQNLYLRKAVGYFHYLLEYVLKISIAYDQLCNLLILLFEFILKCLWLNIKL